MWKELLRIMKKIPCDGCICLPVCISKINFTQDISYSYGYFCHGFDKKKKTCEQLNDFLLIDTESYESMKRFFLKKKKLIY
jgi:hypothetical protein